MWKRYKGREEIRVVRAIYTGSNVTIPAAIMI